MTKRCYYEVLGCQKGAAAAELKASYRKLAMELHPDRNPDDHTSEIKFKEIYEAFVILKDDQ
jgi:molecular chaperone DnaJ